MRRFALIAVCVGMVFAFACSKTPPPDPKKNPPRRMLKPGENPAPNTNPLP